MAASAVRKTDSGKWGRVYHTPDGDFPSVTAILEVINKPSLMRWAANEERKMVMRVSGELYGSLPEGPKLGTPSWIMALEARLGESRAHEKLTQKAKEIGSGVHEYIEYRIRKYLGIPGGEEPQLPEGGAHAYQAFQTWAKTVSFKPRLIEQVVYSVTHRYAGTLDILANVTVPAGIYTTRPHPMMEEYRLKQHRCYNTGLPDGGSVMMIGDWKTSKAIYWESYLQVAAYAMAIVEMGHAQQPLHAVIVRLPKLATDPNFETCFIHADDMPDLFETFLSAKKLWYKRTEAEA